MRVEFDIDDDLELVGLQFERGAKAGLWRAYVRVQGQLGTLQGRDGVSPQEAVDAASRAARTRAREIAAPPLFTVDLTNL